MKKYGVYIALSVVFFVVFLGMRNPWLDQTPGPKRKGRAVISANTFSKHLSVPNDKSCKDHDNTAPAAIILTIKTRGIGPLTTSLQLVAEQPLVSSLYRSIRSSRAPPASIS